MRFKLVIALASFFLIKSGDSRGFSKGTGSTYLSDVNGCSERGIRAWEDPFDGHHKQKGDKCTSVKVTMTEYWGQYFVFPEEEMDEMLGTNDWDQKVIKVAQKGSHSWVGEVKIYNGDSNQWDMDIGSVYGKRATGMDTSQWAEGDSIHLSSCVPTDCFVQNNKKWVGTVSYVSYVRNGCFLKTCIPCQERGWDSYFTPDASTDWGKWGPVKLCPSNGFAIGFDLKVMNSEGRYCDDTALNVIRLICKDSRGIISNLDSGENKGLALGDFDWGMALKPLRCSRGRKLTGANLRTEGKQLAGDDAAATNLAMMCGKYEKLYRSGKSVGGTVGVSRDWGSWGGYKYCPTGMAICGLQTKVEQWDAGISDNTALNRVAFYCCYPLNHRLDICLVLKVEHINHWRDGKSGKYFYFSESDLNKKIGSGWGGTGGTKFEVIQEGSNSWDGSSNNWMGQVLIWKNHNGAHGRRVEGARRRQWNVGDTIKFKNC